MGSPDSQSVSGHSPGGSQSAYGCCCLMASGASEFVRGGRGWGERWGRAFDMWEENMRVKKTEQKMTVRTRDSKHEPTNKHK